MKLNLVLHSNLTPFRINQYPITSFEQDGDCIVFHSVNIPNKSWVFQQDTPIGIGTNIVTDTSGSVWELGIKRG